MLPVVRERQLDPVSLADVKLPLRRPLTGLSTRRPKVNPLPKLFQGLAKPFFHPPCGARLLKGTNLLDPLLAIDLDQNARGLDGFRM
jgi:hypothetical protein